MKRDKTLTAGRAVVRGHLFATLPALLLLLAVYALCAHWIAQPLLGLGRSFQSYFLRLALVSAGALAAGWLWWSAAILRWRVWARSRGADEKETQRLGEKTLLLWPADSMLRKQ